MTDFIGDKMNSIQETQPFNPTQQNKISYVKEGVTWISPNHFRLYEQLYLNFDTCAHEYISNWNNIVSNSFNINIKLCDIEVIFNEQLNSFFDKTYFFKSGQSSPNKNEIFGLKKVKSIYIDFICHIKVLKNEDFIELQIYYICEENSEEYIDQIKDQFKDKLYRSHIVHEVSWYYQTCQGLSSNNLFECFNENLVDDAYPFLPEPVDMFIEKYLKSLEPVLILLGPPGTGKTRLIRYICQKMKLELEQSIMYSMDSKVLTNDQIFIEYLTWENNKALVLEDMDFSLRSRKDGNSDMYRLLGSTDGFIRGVAAKKLIISTNAQTNDIDEALLRPGRCFNVVEARNLNGDEAKKLLLKLDPNNSNINNIIPEQKYSLAEVYSFVNKADSPSQPLYYKTKRRVGFSG